ncbi:MAG: diadenylate cyclase CdaA [Bradymonadia bacterium]
MGGEEAGFLLWDLRGWILTTLDILIVYYLIYRFLLIIKGTRAVPMLIGLLAIILLFFLSQEAFLGLATFNWLLEKFIGSLLLIVVVLFQSDIRRALTQFGRAQILQRFGSGAESQIVDELVKASVTLSNQHIGGLMAIERGGDLTPYMEDSTKLDARVSKELLHAIFIPERQNPLHDGATVIREGRAVASGVFLPMSVNPHLDRSLGTRHRAALGLAEEVDAVVIVISEERGTVSLAVEGALELDLSVTVLRDRLTELLIQRPGGLFRRGGSVVSVLPGALELRRKDKRKGEAQTQADQGVDG